MFFLEILASSFLKFLTDPGSWTASAVRAGGLSYILLPLVLFPLCVCVCLNIHRDV